MSPGRLSYRAPSVSVPATGADHLLLHFARTGGLHGGDAELLVLERGDGVFVVDSLGRRHLDQLSSLFCAQLGYAFKEEMAEAAGQQFVRLGEWFGATRFGAEPDIITAAKGLTSAYAAMGAVLVADYGGHPVAAAIALKNLELFDREDVLATLISDLAVLEDLVVRLGEVLETVAEDMGAPAS